MNEGKTDFENLGVVFNIFNCESKKDILGIKKKFLNSYSIKRKIYNNLYFFFYFHKKY